MRRPAETIAATVTATAIAIHGVVETNVRAVVVGDDGTRGGFFEDFNLRGRRLANPLHGVGEPGIWWICNVIHGYGLSMQQCTAAMTQRKGLGGNPQIT